MNKIIRNKCLSIVLTLAMVMSLFPTVTLPAKAATVLAPGDIVIVAINGDVDSINSYGRGFSFMPLVNLEAGTIINFTDYGWSDVTGAFITNTTIADVFIHYTTPAGGVTAGTIIRCDSYNNADFTYDYSFSGSGNNYLDLAGLTQGDELLVFTGLRTSPTFIFAASIVDTSLVASSWATNVGTAGVSSGSGSALPGSGNATVADLVDDVTALSFNQPASANDNCTYSGPTTPATKAEWQARICNYSNWTFNDVAPIPTPPVGPFTVTDAAPPNAAPTDIALSATSVNENVIANTTVGTLSTTDPDAGNTFTYSLVSGTGDTDNASFNISGTNLRITNSPDFETKSSYSVRVRTTDQGGLTYEEAFTITINDLNETPTDISLSSSSVNENVAGNTTVGTLSSTDPDAANTFTYSLVAGTGSTDNASFNISGSSLRISNSPDYETKNSYSVRVRTTDQGSLFFEKAITISINNINEPPSDITLTATSINQSGGANAVVGTLGTIDVDNADSFTYTLVSGDGDTNNSSFNISGSTLRATDARALAAGTYSVRVRTTDSGSLTYEKAFTITVTDNVAPMVSTVSVPANGTYKAGQNLDFTVNFNENVTVDTLGGTPYITVVIGGMNRQLAYVSGSESSVLVFRYTVQADDGSFDGIGAEILPNGGTIQDAAGNNATPTLFNVSSTAGISIDTTAPAVSSIVRHTPANSLTNAASAIFRVTFNESVTGVDISDFALTKTGDADGTVASLSPVSGTIYDVTVNTISGDGTLRLDLNASGTGIKDAVENPIAEGYSTGETYSIDNTAPTATISMSQTALYSVETATVTITFSEAVTGFTNDDLTIPNGTLTAVSSADGGITWTATFTAANVNAATNSIVLALTGITDTAGNSGSGTASSGNYTVSMPTVPSAPTGVAVTEGDTQASVSFSAPVSNGGAPITGYTVTVNPADVAPVNGAGSPIVVTGLTNGQAYTFTVTATNSVGTGTASAASNSVTPRATQTIIFNNPGAQNFGTSPTLTATSDSGLDVTFTSETTGVCTVTSGGVLTFVTAGTATITAHQAGNASYLPATSVSRSFTVNPVAPGAPTGVTAIAGDEQASVSFTAPVSTGGTSITGYTVTSSPGGFTGTGAGAGSPITVTGLTNGVAYTFTVTAENSAGAGTASAASNSVTPRDTQTITFNDPGAQSFGTSPTLTATSDSGLTVTFTSETPEVCTITSGGVLTFIRAGTATITANQAGDASYLPATPVSRSFTVNPVVPMAPTGVTATAGNAQASVSFSAPVSNGGASITGYTVTSSPGGITATGAGSPITVTGLTNGVAYTFTVTATNSAGAGTASAASNSVTLQTPSGGTSSTSTTPSISAVVEVNGQKQDAGTAITQTTGGQTVTTIKVDDTKLDKILASSGEKPTVTLPTNNASDVVVGELNGQTVKNMEQKEAVLEIRTSSVTYTLPAAQINIDDVSSQIGEQVALKDIKVSVKIAKPTADTVKIVENTAAKNSYQIVVKPVEFEITCTSGSKTVTVSKFNGYVERTVAIPDGIDPSKITTGIVLNNDGTFSHVPTQIVVINGKYFAKINSLTNSTYSVIYNPVTFSDVANHWAKTAVNDMGSRMVVTGIGNSTYAPERSITRAEFAAIVVRALGLRQGTNESSFGDVTLTDWFNGYVDTATDYALITGYDSGIFGPSDTITREQAMAIIARAMKLTGMDVTLTDSQVTALLSRYTDSAQVSAYAKESAAVCLKAGIVNGTTTSTISPKSLVTRAEVAVMVQRLLQASGLI